ncbi:TPA: hypothetical protein JBI69_06780 [Legionella pneumophila]|nr:hypothetical protein [Legionella pneumophila]HAU1994605.1 hypothetical protein [Legionella pneumophila]
MSNTQNKYWFGKAPGHWSTVRVKSLFRLACESSKDNHGMELLSVYTDIGVKPRKELEQKGNKASTTDGYWIVRKGDLVVNKLLAWMGAVGYSEYNGVTSPAYDILRARTTSINPKFYHYLFRLKLTQGEFRRWSKGIMDMRLRLYFSELGNVFIPCPPLSEQNAIVEFIDNETDRIDQLIEKKSQLIEILQLRFNGEVNEIISRFPFRKLKTVASVQLSNVDKHIYKDEISVNVIHYTDVYYNDVVTSQTQLPKGSVTAYEKQKFSMNGGEVLVTKDSETPDDIAIPVYIESTKENTVCGYHIAIIRPNTSKLDGRFLFWGLKTKIVRDYFSLVAQGVTRFGIPIGKISACSVPYIPDIDVQKKIGLELFAKNSKKNEVSLKIRQSIEDLKQFKESLITEAITGQLDIQSWKKRGSTDERLDNIEEAMRA